jgi:hypothetical protein
MKIQAKTNCPLDGFKPCRELECAWFLKIAGKNPNTGTDIEDWGCSMSWLPILLIENAQQQRQTGAAVESFRNEMTSANVMSQQILLATAGLSKPMFLENEK